jgi:hypothetical protein
MEYTHTTSIKVAFIDIDHLVIKYWSSPWFYQRAIVLMGIIGLIYLFNPYAYKWNAQEILCILCNCQVSIKV